MTPPVSAWRGALPPGPGAGRGPAAPPAWVAAETLPGLVLDARRAEPEEILRLLQAMPALSACVLPGTRGLAASWEPPAWVPLLRQAAERTTLDGWVHAVYERFQQAERPANGRWVYGAVAWFGGDRCALTLGAQVRRMAEELNRVGANLGIELLKAIGSDTAIMQLDLLRRKVRRNSVRVRAQQAVEAVAAQRGLSLDALADRIVPDCGLDAEGGREFDFGARRFRFVTGPALVPQVCDEAGVVRKDLPAPRAGDDPRLAAEAVAAWKLLKKSLRETLKSQADRLELAMVRGRTWSPDEFQRFFVGHPVMRHLVRLLVWGARVPGGATGPAFRVAEDFTFCDQEDEPRILGPESEVFLVHPLQLDAAARARWGQVLGDYGLVPPFAQIERSAYALEPSEAGRRTLDRFTGRSVHALSLLSTLTRLGWRQDSPEDGGCLVQHRKTYEGGITVVLRHGDGIPVYDPRLAEPQVLEDCVFFGGDEADSGSFRLPPGLPLGEVPAVILSETIRELTLLTSRSEP